MPVYRELLELAEGLGASDFCLATIGSDRQRKLTPIMDAAFPDAAVLTQQVAADVSPAMLRHASNSTIVAWWAAPRHSAVSAFERLRWVVRTVAIGSARAGLVMPLYAGRCEHGMLVLTGTDFAVCDDTLAAAHLQALELFDRLLKLRAEMSGGHPKLSRRELECLRLTAEGQTSDEIATNLGLSVHTANQYLSNATQKLDAVNRMHAVAKALRFGLID
jgi:DNA-binding CsgD family transcriptional regulator